MKTLRMSLVLALVATSSAWAADVQTTGSEVFPGQVQAGFHPIGFHAGFTHTSVSGFKVAGDISGLLASGPHVSVWLGGGFNPAFG